MAVKKRAPRAVGSIIEQAPAALRQLLERAGENQHLHDAVRALLPDQLVPHVRAVHAEDDTLVVVASSPAWATRLRFVAPALLEQLRSRDDLLVPSRLKLVVRAPAVEPPAAPPPRPRLPSADAAHVLDRCAASLDPGDPLRQTLERLASRTAGRSRD